MAIPFAEYNPEWPHIYEAERDRILDAVGEHLVAIEHIGSTSVPGLAAKPVIDIMPLARSIEAADMCVAPMQELGYVYVPEFEDVMPTRRFFKDRTQLRAFHVHIFDVTGGDWERHQVFRDYLELHADVRDEYEALKRELIARHDDVGLYTDDKDEFVAEVVARAFEELGTPTR